MDAARTTTHVRLGALRRRRAYREDLRSSWPQGPDNYRDRLPAPDPARRAARRGSDGPYLPRRIDKITKFAWGCGIIRQLPSGMHSYVPGCLAMDSNAAIAPM